MVTSDIVSGVLHVHRVAHPDYPSCDRLTTMSKDELISAFYICFNLFMLPRTLHVNLID